MCDQRVLVGVVAIDVGLLVDVDVALEQLNMFITEFGGGTANVWFLPCDGPIHGMQGFLSGDWELQIIWEDYVGFTFLRGETCGGLQVDLLDRNRGSTALVGVLMRHSSADEIDAPA